jgi:hypothetical protein
VSCSWLLSELETGGVDSQEDDQKGKRAGVEFAELDGGQFVDGRGC